VGDIPPSADGILDVPEGCHFETELEAVDEIEKELCLRLASPSTVPTVGDWYCWYPCSSFGVTRIDPALY
jgi:hypothetical protein